MLPQGIELNFSNAGNAILSIFAILAGLGSAVAVFRSAYLKTRLEAAEGAVAGLRGDRDDLSERVTRLEHDNEILTRDLAEEKGKTRTLERVVTAQDDIRQLQQQIAAHDTKLDEELKITKEVQTDVRAIRRKVVT